MMMIIGVIILFLTLSITGIYILDSNDLEVSKQIIPEIEGCYNTIYGQGEKVTEGYATLQYDFLVINQKNEPVEFEFNWGDETTSKTEKTNDRIYVSHEYSKSGTYQIIVRYKGEKVWSEPFEITMKDFFDIAIGEIKTDPSEFRPRQKISLKVDITNLGTISSEKSTRVSFYYLDTFEPKYIDEYSINILKPGQSQSVDVSFKWFNDRDSHTIYAELEEIDGDRTEINNIDYEYFSATKILGFKTEKQRPLLTKLLDMFPNC